MRQPYIDNLRSAIVLLVLVFHAVWLPRTWGVPFSGIPALDIVGCFLYPWIMPCMFLLAGMSARYSLETRTTGQFLAQRVKKLLLPLAGSVLFLAAPLVSLEFHAMGGTIGEMIAYFPSPIIPIFFLAMMGLGPQWFLLELFLFSLVLLLARRLDRKGTLLALAGRTGWLALPLCWLCFHAGSVWGNLANRDLLNLLMLLLGYFVFAHEKIQRRLERIAPVLLAAVLALFAGVTVLFWGASAVYTTPAFLTHPFVTAFGTCAVLAAAGGFKRWLNTDGKLSRLLRERSFAVYLFHYLPMAALSWLAAADWGLPAALEYVLIFLLPLVISLLLFAILRRIPGLRTLFALGKPE